SSRNSIEIAFGDFLFDATELFAQLFPAVVAGSEKFLRERFGLDGAEIVDFELMLTTPLDESGFGDIDLRGDAGETETLSAKENEPGDYFLIFHKQTFLDRSLFALR